MLFHIDSLENRFAVANLSFEETARIVFVPLHDTHPALMPQRSTYFADAVANHGHPC